MLEPVAAPGPRLSAYYSRVPGAARLLHLDPLKLMIAASEMARDLGELGAEFSDEEEEAEVATA